MPKPSLLGVLLLDGARLEIEGAVADSGSFSVPTHYRVVAGASGTVVASSEYAAATDRYVEAARAAAAAGATVLSSNCGFAIAYQDAVREATALPTALSSLLLVPLLARVYGHRVGVLTFDASQLDDDRRRAAGWPPGLELAVADVQHSAAWRRLAGPAGVELEVSEMRADLIGTARRFVDEHEVTALLLECTGFSPFAKDLARSLDLPVYDIVGLTNFLLSGGDQAG